MDLNGRLWKLWINNEDRSVSINEISFELRMETILVLIIVAVVMLPEQ